MIKNKKIIFPLIPVFRDFRKIYNPDTPEKDKIGIRVKENLKLVEKILKKIFSHYFKYSEIFG